MAVQFPLKLESHPTSVNLVTIEHTLDIISSSVHSKYKSSQLKLMKEPPKNQSFDLKPDMAVLYRYNSTSSHVGQN